jgi:nitrous oxide reductase accessory protein NosL
MANIVTRFNVETVTAQGRALYLMHAFGCGMHWTGCAEDAFSYEDEDEAQADADKHGGEVFRFQRWVPGHNERARLEAHFSHQLNA